MHRLKRYANFESPYFSNLERDEGGRKKAFPAVSSTRSSSEFSKCLISSSPWMFFPKCFEFFSFVPPNCCDRYKALYTPSLSLFSRDRQRWKEFRNFQQPSEHQYIHTVSIFPARALRWNENSLPVGGKFVMPEVRFCSSLPGAGTCFICRR